MQPRPAEVEAPIDIHVTKQTELLSACGRRGTVMDYEQLWEKLEKYREVIRDWRKLNMTLSNRTLALREMNKTVASCLVPFHGEDQFLEFIKTSNNFLAELMESYTLFCV